MKLSQAQFEKASFLKRAYLHYAHDNVEIYQDLSQVVILHKDNNEIESYDLSDSNVVNAIAQALLKSDLNGVVYEQEWFEHFIQVINENDMW